MAELARGSNSGRRSFAISDFRLCKFERTVQSELKIYMRYVEEYVRILERFDTPRHLRTIDSQLVRNRRRIGVGGDNELRCAFRFLSQQGEDSLHPANSPDLVLDLLPPQAYLLSSMFLFDLPVGVGVELFFGAYA